MAFPIVLFAAVAISALVAGGAAAVAVFGKRAKGSRVLLIGPRQAGKSTLRRYLQSGIISRDYVETHTTERVEAHLQMSDLELDVVIHDPGGSVDQYGEWFALSRQADVVVYLFDASRLDDPAYADLAINGAQHLAHWRRDGSVRERTRVLVVATHRDQHRRSGGAGFEDGVRSHPVFRAIVRTADPHTRALHVSLVDTADCDSVLWAVASEAGR